MNGTCDCGAFLERMQHEHHELNRALLEIRQELVHLAAGERDQRLSGEIAKRLRALSSELQQHFAEQENGGCVAEVLARCPSLAARVQTMCDEHPALLRAVEGLISSAAGQGTAQEQLPRDFERFADQLQAHEALENRLLQMALGGDASEFDVEGNE